MSAPSNPFRILIVDDSSVVRRVLKDVISGDPGLTVAGTAANGQIALSQIAQLNPDLMILDVEMPELDGLATLAELRKTNRRLPVIMFSTLTHRGAEATLDALSLGADDYVPKERNTLGLAAAIDDLRRDLLPKIHALCARRMRTASKVKPTPVAPVAKLPRLPEQRIDAVIVGVSTGGPDALNKVVPAIPADLPVPVVIVQHMPAIFTKFLAERLQTKACVPVKEAAGNDVLVPGTIWLAQGGRHLIMVKQNHGVVLQMHDAPLRNFCRPSVDVLFESAVEVYDSRLLAVMLTGMGSDGLKGCELVRQRGGQVIAQDEETSVVWGMPGAVVRAGLADSIKPLPMIAAEIVRRVQRLRVPEATVPADANQERGVRV